MIGFSNMTQTIAEKNVNKTLYTCRSCCTKIPEQTKSNVLGFLTLAQHREYRKDDKNAVELHSRGFVVLKRDQWENGVHLPISEFIKVLKKSQQNSVDV